MSVLQTYYHCFHDSMKMTTDASFVVVTVVVEVVETVAVAAGSFPLVTSLLVFRLFRLITISSLRGVVQHFRQQIVYL